MYRTTQVMTLTAVLLVALPVSVGAGEASAETGVAGDGARQELVAEAEFFGIDLALDAAGHRHIAASQVFPDDEGTKDRYEGLRRDLWYATDRDGSWTMQRLLQGDAETSLGWTDPSIAVDADGSVHIAVVHDYVGSTPGQTEGIFYLTDKGRAPGRFGEPVRVAGRNMTGPSLAVADGVRYLAYTKLVPFADPPPPDPVFIATDVSGSWTRHRLADSGDAPVLAVDASGRAHVVYQRATKDGRGAFLAYVRTDPVTGEPLKSHRIPGTDGIWYGADLALDPSGRPHVTWETEDDILWTARTADGWSGPEGLGVRRSDWQSLAVDELGQPHVVFGGRGRGDTGRGVIHAQRSAGTWPQAALVARVGWTQVASATFGPSLWAAWTPSHGGQGLSVYGPLAIADTNAAQGHRALEDLLAAVPYSGCTPFTEHGANDPFSRGARAAIHCATPTRGVRQAALFRFPDVEPMADYWRWRVKRIEPNPPAREGACADGRRGLTTWAHGQLVCYVAQPSKEAKLRWTDERTGTYGVLDASSRDIAQLHAVWSALVAAGDEGRDPAM